MNKRHQEQLSSKLVSTVIMLTDHLVDKSAQARKLVQWNFIDPILKDARELFINVTDMLDGVDSKNKALKNIYHIQKQTVLVCYLEKDKRKKKVNGKPKKHYGFDFAACAYIDNVCDDLIAQVCSYSQSHQPYDRG